ncbi:MAG: CPBP family intramembrane metalloprotease [Nitrospira sp.]|nr:CPBP family intramembrane metalloprotease [Nitrospira sp.]
MTDDSLQISQQQWPGETDPRPSVRSSTDPFQSAFSRTISLLSAVVLLAALGAIIWLSATLPKFDQFEEPNRALELMVGRTMDVQEGLRRAPRWQQWLAEWTIGSSEKERLQAIRWYHELVHVTGDPLATLQLAILQGESGLEEEALAGAREWQELAPPMPLYGQWIEAAYGDHSLNREATLELQASLAETLPAGWFYNRLAARLAQRTGDQALLATIERQIASQGRRLQQRSNRLLFIELTCLLLGSIVLARIMLLRNGPPDAMRVHVPGVPPPWPGGIGTSVLLRGGALGAVITTAFLTFPPAEHTSLRTLAIPLANLPLLILAYVHLLRPAGLNFWSGFGLRIERAQLGRLIGAIFAVIAAGLWGEWVMARAIEWWGLSNHWTEWFDANLVWASGSTLAVSLLEYVVFAPIFEELAFRGLLYAILRRRLSFAPAALLSASVFALAHGYGLIGFISVLWSGFLWAWIYEKTGSLIPGMIAHAMNNLLVCLAVMALLR